MKGRVLLSASEADHTNNHRGLLVTHQIPTRHVAPEENLETT
jgi:hypothetical protein